VKIAFRISETIKEMFSEPRVNGVIMFWGLPTIVAFGSCSFEGAIIISSILFLLCFFIVRFSLD
jgi:hypothetical protein